MIGALRRLPPNRRTFWGMLPSTFPKTATIQCETGCMGCRIPSVLGIGCENLNQQRTLGERDQPLQRASPALAFRSHASAGRQRPAAHPTIFPDQCRITHVAENGGAKPESLATFRGARPSRPRPSASRRRNVARTTSPVRWQFVRVANDWGAKNHLRNDVDEMAKCG
jgi:hypothetical protein